MSNVSTKHREITRLKNGYELEVVRLEDVFADINFSDDDDFNICKDIIVNLEFKAGVNQSNDSIQILASFSPKLR